MTHKIIAAFLLFAVLGAFNAPEEAHAAPASVESCPGEGIDSEATRLISSVEPLYDAISNGFGEKIDRTRRFRQRRARVLRRGSYRTRMGWRIDASCLNEDRTPEVIEATLDKVFLKVKNCGRFRLFGEAHPGFERAMRRRRRVTCDSETCGKNAAACIHGQKILNFKRPDHMTNEKIWFHELLHHTRGVDNQDWRDHNRVEDTRADDEVYFWEEVCFEPGKILERMRDGDAEACRRPLEYSNHPRKKDHPARRVAAMCRLFEAYLEKEERFSALLNEELLPLTASCGDAEPGLDCERERARNVDRYSILGGGYLSFPAKVNRDGAESPLDSAIRFCASESGPKSAHQAMCEVFHRKIKRPMAELLGHWK